MLSLNHFIFGYGLADEVMDKRSSLSNWHSWSVKPLEITGAAVTFKLNELSVEPTGLSSLHVSVPVWSTRTFLTVSTRWRVAASYVCSIPSVGVKGLPSRNKVILGNGRASIWHSIVAVSPCLTVVSTGFEMNSGDSKREK
jgi:hypothetical protein